MNRCLFIVCVLLVALHVGAATACPAPVEWVDTLDEDDYLAMKDTIKMPRRNLAKLNNKAVDLRNYVVKDVYIPEHQTFEKHWYDHIYVGGGLGVERLAPLCDDPSYKLFTTVNLHVGKQFTKYSGVRLAVSGGWGYQSNSEPGLGKVGFKADYLHNLSTLLAGYNPARRMEVSLLAGLGGHYMWASGKDSKFAPEAHLGVQLKCYTGPQGVINIEPYMGIGSDNLDLSESNNYHRYDLFYGINVNYSCFTDDNLSKEARLKLLQSRMADERMVNATTLERWRTPWFVEYAVGPAVVPVAGVNFSDVVGNSMSLSVGRWLSPVMGVRLTASSRMSNVPGYYKLNYVYGGLDALLNPLGFLRSFRWQSPWGVYLTFGMGIGQLMVYPVTQYNVKDNLFRSENYRIGAHFWGRLSEDLQAFLEPYYAANVYSSGMLQKYSSYGLNVGVTMLICSHKFRNLSEMDDAQNYTYKNVRGFHVGIAGGMPVMQNTVDAGGSGVDWNALAFLEYRFNHLHSVRLMGEWLRLNTVGTASSKMTISRNIVLGSLDYMVNLTNLCSGRFVGRRVELNGFVGPSMGYVTVDRKMMAGANLGLKLDVNIWKSLTAFVTPTLYMMYYNGMMDGLNTVGIGYLHLLHTINIGVQYKIGSLHLNPEAKRLKAQHKAVLWRNRQLEKEHEWQLQQELKQSKRKKKYGY